MDNDVYGHVNNVVYYSYFDTAVNKWLIDRGLLDPATSPIVGLVAATSCHYFRPISFPNVVDAGLRVAHIGRSSVRYEIGLFAHGEQAIAAAGQFTHVYVDRRTMAPSPVTHEMRGTLRELAIQGIS
jgi:acyl-CoA thioester hydrolase